jgi:hypothetical protein
MSIIKFTCKNPTYQLKDPKGSIISNPKIVPTAIQLSWKNQIFRIPFEMSVKNTEGIDIHVPEGSGSKQFDHINTESIVNFNGNEMEVEQALMSGWAYNSEEVLSWGKPSFQNVFDYVDVTANGLVFKEGPGKQLAIDLILNTVMIEGEPLGTHFELEIV